MNGNAMSSVQVRRVGMGALLEKLGTVGMIRFLQQDETGRGDYSIERHAWLDGRTVESVAEQILRSRSNSNPSQTS